MIEVYKTVSNGPYIQFFWHEHVFVCLCTNLKCRTVWNWIIHVGKWIECIEFIGSLISIRHEAWVELGYACDKLFCWCFFFAQWPQNKFSCISLQFMISTNSSQICVFWYVLSEKKRQCFFFYKNANNFSSQFFHGYRWRRDMTYLTFVYLNSQRKFYN